MGVQLFVRDKKSVRLTKEGKALYAKSKQVVEQFEGLKIEILKEEQRKVNIRIGFVASAYIEFIEKMTADFERLYPNISLNFFEYSNIKDFEKYLIDGRLDLAFVYPPVSHEKLDSQLVTKEEFNIVIRDDNPLAQKPRLGVADLEGQKLIFHPREVAPELYDYLYLVCANAGFKPIIHRKITSQASRLIHVSKYGGLAFATSRLKDFSASNLVFKEIEQVNLKEVGIALAWKRGKEVKGLEEVKRWFG